MEHLDKIQWYEVLLIIITTVGAIHADGRPRPNFDFKMHFIGLIIALPTIGRIFGWW